MQWKLIDDDYYEVRIAVAESGTDAMRALLVNDEDDEVRAAVAEHGTEDMHTKMLHDTHYFVRDIIAKKGTHVMRKILAYDVDDSVRQTAIQNIHDVDFLTSMLSDNRIDDKTKDAVNKRLADIQE